MRIRVSIALAIVCLLTIVGPVAARTPTAGDVREYAPGTVLSYRYGAAGYPSWMQTAIQAALGADWRTASANNTRLPTYSYSASGGGAVYYSASATSPCGTGNTQWLQCASNWGTSSWRIYVRNFSGAPYGNWTWCNISFSGTCWDAERALVHEAEHVTMGIANHDSQGEANTVMGSVSPWYANTGWNTHHIQRCDEAAGQLLYGMLAPSGPVADCFDSIAGHGSVGLIPALTAPVKSISACRSQTATLSGGFAVASNGQYAAMSGQSLAGRTVWFDRKLHSGSTWTLNVASAVTATGATNWSRSFSSGTTTAVTYDFRPHTASELGLDGATGPTITVTWGAAC
jgi:hypothetical protein